MIFQNRLLPQVEMSAVSDKPTIVNLSNHAYFNLAGHGSGWTGMAGHTLRAVAEEYTPDDAEFLPTGKSIERSNERQDK